MKSITKHLPFVSRRKYDAAIEALSEANRENKRAIVAMFQYKQACEKRTSEEIRDVYNMFLGQPCEIGGVKFRVRR